MRQCTVTSSLSINYVGRGAQADPVVRYPGIGSLHRGRSIGRLVGTPVLSQHLSAHAARRGPTVHVGQMQINLYTLKGGNECVRTI